MRGLGGLSLILLAILAGLIWAVTWGPLRDIALIRPQSGNIVPRATPPAEPAAERAPAPRVRTASGSLKEGVPSEDVAATSEQVPVHPAPPATPPPPTKFPTAVDVPLGMLGSSLLDSFGAPVGRTLAVDEGGRTEIFVYRRSRPDTTTVIHLRNGRVVSAVTTAY